MNILFIVVIMGLIFSSVYLIFLKKAKLLTVLAVFLAIYLIVGFLLNLVFGGDLGTFFTDSFGILWPISLSKDFIF